VQALPSALPAIRLQNRPPETGQVFDLNITPPSGSPSTLCRATRAGAPFPNPERRPTLLPGCVKRLPRIPRGTRKRPRTRRPPWPGAELRRGCAGKGRVYWWGVPPQVPWPLCWVRPDPGEAWGPLVRMKIRAGGGAEGDWH